MSAGLFIFKRVIWPTFDAYCDIMLAIYCVYHGVLEWGLAITLPMISNLATSISAYVRMRRRGFRLNKTPEQDENKTPETIWSAEGFALPLLIWPQVWFNLLRLVFTRFHRRFKRPRLVC